MRPHDVASSELLNREDIEEIIENALGESVTPSRLRDYSRDALFLNRIRGGEAGPHPIFSYIGPTEQPHYIFRGDGRYGIGGRDKEVQIPDEYRDNSRRKNRFSPASWTSVPSICVVTDETVSIAYGFENDDVCTVVLPYEDIVHSSVDDSLLSSTLEIATSEAEYYFKLSRFDSYTTELRDAASYVSDKAAKTATEPEYTFSTEDFAEVQADLRAELGDLIDATAGVDVSQVLKVGARGAAVRGPKDPRSAGAAFVLAAGYDLFHQIYTTWAEEEADISSDDIDPSRAAKTISRFQKVGKEKESRSLQIGLSVLGSAVSIAEQAPEGSRISVLSTIDSAAVPEAIEEGNTAEAGIEVATNVVQRYSDDLADVLDEEFFRELDSFRRSSSG